MSRVFGKGKGPNIHLMRNVGWLLALKNFTDRIAEESKLKLDEITYIGTDQQQLVVRAGEREFRITAVVEEGRSPESKG